MAAPSAAMALREAYGDRKPPDITRKITACVACRKLKIKCHMTNSKPPCSRCKGRGLNCTVNKSIQMILENDITWKEEIEERVKSLEKLLARKTTSRNDDAPSVRHSFGLESPMQDSPMALATATPSSAADTSLNLSCSLGAFPASSITGQPLSDAGQSSNTKPDLIARGLLPEEAGQELFEFYHDHLDRHIYNLLARSGSLSEVRSRSSLLTAAVCTVAALASASRHYESCLKAFQAEVAGELFSKDHTFDDIRAMCIGSFWLGEISVALCALAVRFSSELNLHRCITKMPHIKWKCYERTRLYFLVFICDHHCSLKHGRPPMTRTMRSLQNPRALLRSEFSVPSDAKLISHLELWSLSNRVFDLFGADVGSPFDPHRSADLEQLSHYFDEWRRQWTDSLSRRDALDQFEEHNMDLYFYSAKLCLFSHVFRGPPSRATNTGMATTLARSATECALSFVRCVAAGYQAASLLPSYLITMAAFASVFLLGASSANAQFVDKAEVLKALHQLFDVLDETGQRVHPSNPFLVVANGLSMALGSRPRSSPATHQQLQGGESAAVHSPPAFDLRLLPKDVLGLASTQNIDWTAFSTEFEADCADLWNVDLGSVG